MSQAEKFNNVFVTVGTTRFDHLVTKLLSNQVLQRLCSLGCQKLVIQAGKSVIPKYEERGIKIDIFDYKESIADDISKADLIIGHSGAGTALEVLRSNKPFISVINSSLMDNHQLELAQQLSKDGHLIYCYPESLFDTLHSVREMSFKPLPAADPKAFPNFLDHVMGFS